MFKKTKKERMRAKMAKDKFRLVVFRSNRHLYAQIIEPRKAEIIASASDFDIKKKPTSKKLSPGLAMADKIGQLIAERALKKKVKEIIFDRSPYAYHGKVKAIAEGARSKGLKF